MRKKKLFIIMLLLTLLSLTRFVNLGWGLPLPFHPDERNMSNAILRMNEGKTLNPHFFAYGQFPLYLAYFLSSIISSSIEFSSVTLTLRIISAISSLLTVYFSLKIIELVWEKDFKKELSLMELSFLFLIFTFSPALIQFAHFGTTESLLMLFYTAIVYYSIRWYETEQKRDLEFLSLFFGLSLATKVSSLIFILFPLFIFFLKRKGKFISQSIKFVTESFVIFFIASPYNLIAFPEFISSLNYESGVATGRIIVFYTQQFVDTIPYLFQIKKIFPYAMGFWAFLIFVVSFLFFWKKKRILFLRAAFFLFFLLEGALFAKWTRFMVPIFPLILILSSLFLLHLFHRIKPLFYILLILTLLPGIAFLNIYFEKDVRYKASCWMFNHIEEKKNILSEGGNVVDIPFYVSQMRGKCLPKQYKLISFDFYNLDKDKALKQSLEKDLINADYVLVPSRRVFANYTCVKKMNNSFAYWKNRCSHLQNNYPLLNEYYSSLFSRNSDFRLIKTISNNPSLRLFNFTLYRSNDENAEETWSVFDHPVIRIFKRS